MSNLNLGQDVANRRERKLTAAQILAKSDPLYLAVKCAVTVLLLTSTPLNKLNYAGVIAHLRLILIYSCTLYHKNKMTNYYDNMLVHLF